MIDWIKRIGGPPRVVESDANDLIERLGDQAYFEARNRAQRDAATVDANRPRGHWTRVKLEIAKRQGIEIGASGADKRQ